MARSSTSSPAPAPEPNGHKLIHIVGTAQQLNDALDDLVYTPDAGYYYDGIVDPENLHLVMVPGNSDDINRPIPPTGSMDIDIRVFDVNDFPTHGGPPTKSAQPGIELVMQRRVHRRRRGQRRGRRWRPGRPRRLPRTHCPTARTPTCCSSAG